MKSTPEELAYHDEFRGKLLELVAEYMREGLNRNIQIDRTWLILTMDLVDCVSAFAVKRGQSEQSLTELVSGAYREAIRSGAKAAGGLN
jgi:hypothetical protein